MIRIRPYKDSDRETGTREAYTVNGQQWMAIDMECRKTNK